MAEEGYGWLEMAINGRIWLRMAGDGYGLLETAMDGWRWLRIAGDIWMYGDGSG